MMVFVGPVDFGDNLPLPDFSRDEQGLCTLRILVFARQAIFIHAVPSLSKTPFAWLQIYLNRTRIGYGIAPSTCRQLCPVVYAR